MGGGQHTFLFPQIEEDRLVGVMMRIDEACEDEDSVPGQEDAWVEGNKKNKRDKRDERDKRDKRDTRYTG